MEIKQSKSKSKESNTTSNTISQYHCLEIKINQNTRIIPGNAPHCCQAARAERMGAVGAAAVPRSGDQPGRKRCFVRFVQPVSIRLIAKHLRASQHPPRPNWSIAYRVTTWMLLTILHRLVRSLQPPRPQNVLTAPMPHCPQM